MTSTRRSSHESSGALLALDPELGCLLPPERRAGAERELRVRLTTIQTGEWEAGRLEEADPAHFGLLVADGVLAREVVLQSTVSTELLGAGDIVRPWRIEGSPLLLPVTVRWNALSRVRIALLDRRVAIQIGAYPEIGAAIVDRLSERAQRLAVSQAISQLNRVEDRLVALFWLLAERWGRVAADGVALPLALSHRLLGELVGARRPTVSTALAELARGGALLRRDDGTWLLTGEAPGRVGADAAEVVRQRRRLMPEEQRPAAPGAPAPAPRASARAEELLASAVAARESTVQRRHELEALRAEASALQAHTIALRRAHEERLQSLRSAGSPPRR
jgi:CRP/FNR family cyclic AMP-dependent transcriptional regulator